jgi:hypothetical protein
VAITITVTVLGGTEIEAEAIADFGNALMEFIESNNTLSKTVTVVP